MAISLSISIPPVVIGIVIIIAINFFIKQKIRQQPITSR